MQIVQWGTSLDIKNWKVELDCSCGYLRIYHIISGQIHYIDDENDTILEEGGIYIFPTNKAYKMYSDDFACTWLHVDVSPYMVNSLVCAKDDIYDNIMTLSALIINKNNNVFQDIQSCSNMFVNQALHDKFIVKIDAKFIDIVQELKNLSLTKISIQEFANKYDYTVEHFTRVFKEKVKVSPYQFLLDCKMNKAREELRSGRSSLEICEILGYSDVRSFVKAFKRKNGCSPTEYRKYYYRYM